MNNPDFLIENYDYDLPQSLIAQKPSDMRDASRLMHLNRASGRIEHLSFRDIIKLFRKNDTLLLNNSRVFPARLGGRRETGGKVEIFLLHFPVISGKGKAIANALSRSSKPLKPGNVVTFSSSFHAEILKKNDGGNVDVKLHFSGDLEEALAEHGMVPLPPYISRNEQPEDRTRYQTVYATETGSVAAPTAGLHFTEDILDQIRAKGVKTAFVTLHVGYGTFAPVRSRDIRGHSIHEEFISIPKETAYAVEKCRKAGGRVFAAGTTSVRGIEECSSEDGMVNPRRGSCRLYITPGYRFKVVDCIITNFHLPRSSLLILVSAFAGRKPVLDAYSEAIRSGYRFYSYGDAMVIT